MPFTTDQVLQALQKVIVPGTNSNIVSLNMVKDISIEGDKIGFSLIFKKSNDPLIASVHKACILTIKKQLGQQVQIERNIKVLAETMYEEKKLPGVKNIIAVASGKGGVGKSTIAVNLAVILSKKGYKVGLIDGDIYGPSIPKMFNTENAKPLAKDVEGKALILPLEKFGVKILSVGFFVNPNNALVWRGPMATQAIRQLINDADWGELDYLLHRSSPRNGDIHLTIVQEIPLTGVIIVSTPQDIALADAIKGISMFRSKAINVPVLGLVENMAWFTPEELPDNKYYIFGKDGCKKLAENMNLPLLGQIPLVQGIREGGDKGFPSVLENTTIFEAFSIFAEKVIEQVNYRNKNIAPTQVVKINK